MKAIQIKQYGKEDVMELVDLPMPIARDGELLVKVKAAAVNPVDCKIREGLGQMMGMTLPIVLGCEIAGTVESSNDGDFAAGHEVYGYLGAHSGGYAEFVAAPASELCASRQRWMLRRRRRCRSLG